MNQPDQEKFQPRRDMPTFGEVVVVVLAFLTGIGVVIACAIEASSVLP